MVPLYEIKPSRAKPSRSLQERSGKYTFRMCHPAPAAAMMMIDLARPQNCPPILQKAQKRRRQDTEHSY